MVAGSVRVGMGQMLVEPGQREANLARAAQMVGRAAAAGCDVVVLPECLDLGWTHASARTQAQPVPGPTATVLAEMAADHGIMIAAGLVERADERVYNSAILLSAQGEVLLRHRKVNELDFARALYATGTTVGVADTAQGRVGLNICADNHVTALGHAQGAMGARILLSPSSWAVPPDHDNERTPYGEEWVRPYRELALTHGMPVIGVSNVGPVVGGTWDGWRCIGSSLAVGADGTVLAQGPYGEDAEELVVVTVPLAR